MTVSNLRSRNGNKVPNQFFIEDDEGNTFFQSYKSIIVKKDKNGQIYLDCTFFKYSRTTTKYRNIFLDESTADVQRKIKEGIYLFADLNHEGQDRESYSDDQDRESYK